MIDVGYEVELQYDVKGLPRGAIGTVEAGGELHSLQWRVRFPDEDRTVWVPDGALELA